MNNELKVLNEVTIVNGVEVKVIEGGFGENCRILTETYISNVHKMELYEVRKSIKRLLDKNRIVENIDFIDLKKGSKDFPTFIDFLLQVGYKKTSITQAGNIFILSERGYCKLIKSMDDDKSWDIMDEMVDNYFFMRKQLKESQISNLLLDIYNGGQNAVLASKQLTEIEVKKATEPLKLEIKDKVKLIDNMTQDLDGTVLRVIVTDYVNKIARNTNKRHFEIYNEIYKILGRKLKKDLKSSCEKFKQSEIKKVEENREYNVKNGLKGINKKLPHTLKESKYKISVVEYVCDILGEGNLLVEVMAKVFEVGIDEIISKHNYKMGLM